MMQVYDRVVPTGGVITLLWITAVLAVAIAYADGAGSHPFTRILMRASLRLNRLLSGEILDRLMSRAKMKQGEPASTQAMREFDTIRQTVGGPAASAVFDAPWTPLYLIVAFAIHPALGWLIIGAGIVLVTLALLNERQTSRKSGKAHQASAAAYAAHQATVSEGEAIRALGMRRSLVNRQIMQRAEGLEAAGQVQLLGVRYNTLVKFIRMFMQSLALGVGAWLAVTNQISVGSIIAASVLLSRALQPVEQLVGSWPTIMQARNALDTHASALRHDGSDGFRAHRAAEAERRAGAGPYRRQVDGAGSRAGSSQRVDHPEAGEMLGVIGPSGSGKSTWPGLRLARLCPTQARCALMAPTSRIGIRNRWPCMSATCRRTSRCFRERSAKTSRASVALRPWARRKWIARSSRQPRWRVPTT